MTTDVSDGSLQTVFKHVKNTTIVKQHIFYVCKRKVTFEIKQFGDHGFDNEQMKQLFIEKDIEDSESCRLTIYFK